MWENPSPGSTFYCRPIKFIFCKDSNELVRDEKNTVSFQINNLVNFKSNVNSHEIEIQFEIKLTMLNGKIYNTLAENSASSRWYI